MCVCVCEQIGRSKIDRPCTLFDYYSKTAINTVNANSIAFHYSTLFDINKVNYTSKRSLLHSLRSFRIISFSFFYVHLTFHRLALLE